MGQYTMKIDRNMSILQFQRRLIHTAQKSPKLEALNLYGIIYSNLMEFFHVRVPLDMNRNDIMEDWCETFDILCRSIRGSFINLCVLNELDIVEGTIVNKCIHDMTGARAYSGNSDQIVKALNIICRPGSDLYKAIHGEEIGIFAHNQFYHRIAVAHSLVQYWDEIQEKLEKATVKISSSTVALLRAAREVKAEMELICSRANISMPSAGTMSYIRTQAEFQRFAKHWAEEKDDPKLATARLIIRLDHHEMPLDIDSEDTWDVKPFTPPKEAGRFPHFIYNYGIMVSNPIFFEFDRVAKMILAHDGVDPYPSLRYDEDGLDDYHGIYFLQPELGMIGNDFRNDTEDILMKRIQVSCERSEPILIRTPVRTIEHAIPKSISMALFGSADITNELFACKSFTEIKSLASRKSVRGIIQLDRAQLTLYRTGKIQKRGNVVMIDDDNAKLVVFIALLCRKKANIFIECRARDDELNNLWLVKILQNIANVNVVPRNNRGKKVHAKLWSFVNQDGSSLSVVSTGNFSDGAQTNFSDTYLITPSSSTDGLSAAFNREIWTAMAVAGIGDQSNDTAVDMREYTEAVKNGGCYGAPFISLYGGIHSTYSTIISLLSKVIYTIFPRTCYGMYPNEYSREHRDGTQKYHFRIKCNHITDPVCIRIIQSDASENSKIDVMVRTTSTIPLMGRPKNLQVRSIMGRYLEHDRIFILEREGSEPVVYIGSVDLMPRNLNNRIESLVKIPDEWAAFKRIIVRTFDDMFERETDPKAGFFNYKV